MIELYNVSKIWAAIAPINNIYKLSITLSALLSKISQPKMRFHTVSICVFAVFVGQVFGATDKVICYYASWAVTRPGGGQYGPDKMDPHVCTHINYAFAGLNQDGSIEVQDEEHDVNDGGFRKVAGLKEKNPNLKVLLSVGGAAGGGGFGVVAGNQQLEQNFAQSAIQFFEKYNFDGLDVDWEYPNDAGAFNSMLNTLKSAFQPRGYLLTAAVNSIPSDVGGYDVAAMSNALDIINVMTYDFHGAWAGTTGENSPLYAGDFEPEWEKLYQNCDAALGWWISKGAEPQKLALGIGFYGHSYKLQDPGRHGINDPTVGPADPGPYTNNMGTLGYSEICEFHRNGQVAFLEDMRVPYLYDGDFWVGYDNEQSIREKVQYAKEHNLAGVFVWSMDTDDINGYCGGQGLLPVMREAMGI